MTSRWGRRSKPAVGAVAPLIDADPLETADAAGLELVACSVGVVASSKVLLDRVDCVAPPGQTLVITGPSGAGKSTLLFVLAGLLVPSSGEVRYGGAPVIEDDDGFRRARGVVLQNYGLISTLTAAENVELPLQARRVPARRCEQLADDSLAAVGLAALGGRPVGELSGGQRQRVAVARALAGGPCLLLADEPTAELDAESRAVVLEVLLGQARRGATVVIASHDPEVIAACDAVLSLRDGQVVKHELVSPAD